jgi:hypothetical protein
MRSHNLRDVDLGIAVIGPSDQRRFWAKVERKEAGQCWLWMASTWNSGYGQFRVALPCGRQKTYGAHRFAWEVSHGSVPSGLHVLHRCDEPRCCNAAHLFLGTHVDNMRDAASKRRLSVPRPSRQKLTDAQCEDMVALRRGGMTLQAIGDRYGVTKTQVSLVVRGLRRQYRQRPVLEKAS